MEQKKPGIPLVALIIFFVLIIGIIVTCLIILSTNSSSDVPQRNLYGNTNTNQTENAVVNNIEQPPAEQGNETGTDVPLTDESVINAYKLAGNYNVPAKYAIYQNGDFTSEHLSEVLKLKMAFARVACLETEHYLASYSHADFRPIGRSCVEFFELLASFGVTQHFAIVDGDYTAPGGGHLGPASPVGGHGAGDPHLGGDGALYASFSYRPKCPGGIPGGVLGGEHLHLAGRGMDVWDPGRLAEPELWNPKRSRVCLFGCELTSEKGRQCLPFSFYLPKTPVFLAFPQDFDYNCLQCVQHLATGMGYNNSAKGRLNHFPCPFSGNTADGPARKDSPSGAAGERCSAMCGPLNRSCWCGSTTSIKRPIASCAGL